MRKRALVYSAVGTAGALFSSIAVAADSFDWTGFYAGIAVGVVYPEGSVPFSYPDGTATPGTVVFDGNVPIFGDVAPPTSPIPFPAAATFDASGYSGTVTAGYNLQRGVVVVGAEVDASILSGIRSSWTTGTVVDITNNRTHEVSVSGGIDQLYSARARVGVAVDRLLLFGTAGLALGHADLETLAYLDNGYGSADWSGRASGLRMGVILGGGAEYAVSDNMSLKIEGLYYSLGGLTTTATGTGAFGVNPLNVASYDATLDLSGFSIRGGVNLRFQ